MAGELWEEGPIEALAAGGASRPDQALAAGKLKVRDAIIDSEATVLGDTGLPDFQALRRELGKGRPAFAPKSRLGRPALRVARCSGSCAMASSADDCWRLSGDCGRWAAESSDDATREAFRQMAKVWAQLAFSLNFTPPPLDQEIIDGSEASKNAAPEPEHRTSDSDEGNDSRQRTPQPQRLSLPSRRRFPER
jgi:hypothetical protein